MTRKVKILRRIDLFVGRHMGVRRWIVFWLVVAGGCLCLLFSVQSWAVYTFCPIGVILGLIMAWGNLRRLR